MSAQKLIQISYFAILREQRGVAQEQLSIDAETPASLYRALAEKHGFSLNEQTVRAAVNDRFVDMHAPLADGDKVTFIPPVAGG